MGRNAVISKISLKLILLRFCQTWSLHLDHLENNLHYQTTIFKENNEIPNVPTINFYLQQIKHI